MIGAARSSLLGASGDVNFISFVAVSSDTGSGSGWDSGIPAGVQVGDLLVLTTSIRINGAPPGGGPSDPVGFTARIGTRDRGIWTKIATGSDDASFVVNGIDSVGSAVCAAFRNATGDVVNGYAETSNTSAVMADITATDAGSWLVAHFATSHSTTSASSWTPPSGMTEIFDFGGASDFRSQALYYEEVGAGSTGTRTAVSSVPGTVTSYAAGLVISPT